MIIFKSNFGSMYSNVLNTWVFTRRSSFLASQTDAWDLLFDIAITDLDSKETYMLKVVSVVKTSEKFKYGIKKAVSLL